MQSETTTLHSRAQHPTVGQLHTMYDEEEKFKGGFRSSNFYRTRIRGSRCNGLMFSISVTLATLCIYYLVYWRNGRGVNEVRKDKEIVLENVNPKFDGVNKRVELDNEVRKFDDVGEEFINQDEDRHHIDLPGNPQKRGDGGSNDLSKKENRGRKNQQNEDRFQPVNRVNSDDEEDEIYDGKDDRVQILRDQPMKVDPKIGKPRNMIDNEPNYDFGEENVEHDMRQAVPRPKPQVHKNPARVLPVGREGAVILNHRGKLSDINPKDIAPVLPDVLGRQPVKKQDFALQLPRNINPDYIDVERHNMDPRNQPKLPKFKPNRHINPEAHNPADMKPKPRPKEFPVTILQKPNPAFCPTTPFVLILVLSQDRETFTRHTIRNTWGNPDKFHVSGMDEVDMTWWVIFAMGSGKADENIKLENDKNGDILQGEFVDIESEETRKVMMTMLWLNNLQISNPGCRPHYFLKTGSHVFVNTRVLTKWMNDEFQMTQNVYVGQVIRNDDPIRDSFDPHFIPYLDFSREVFPELVRGPTFMLTMDVINRMVPLFNRVTPIAMDDAYIGILASELNINPRHDEHFVHPKRPSNVCHYRNMMYIFGVNPNEIKHVYSVIMGHAGRHCLNQGL